MTIGFAGHERRPSTTHGEGWAVEIPLDKALDFRSAAERFVHEHHGSAPLGHADRVVVSASVGTPLDPFLVTVYHRELGGMLFEALSGDEMLACELYVDRGIAKLYVLSPFGRAVDESVLAHFDKLLLKLCPPPSRWGR